MIINGVDMSLDIFKYTPPTDPTRTARLAGYKGAISIKYPDIGCELPQDDPLLLFKPTELKLLKSGVCKAVFDFYDGWVACKWEKVPFNHIEKKIVQEWEQAQKDAELDRQYKQAIIKSAKLTEVNQEQILPGWHRNKLRLDRVPNGPKEPAVFIFGAKTYTVPSGKAWELVCQMINANAFDGHGVEMNSPNELFTRRHRLFFNDILRSVKDKNWYLVSKEQNNSE